MALRLAQSLNGKNFVWFRFYDTQFNTTLNLSIMFTLFYWIFYIFLSNWPMAHNQNICQWLSKLHEQDFLKYVYRYIIAHVLYGGLDWRCGGAIASWLPSALASVSSNLSSSHGRGHCVVFLGKTLYSHSASIHSSV